MRSEDKAGLYLTIIFHLVVIIVMLAGTLGAALKGESSFLLDFSKQEEAEQLAELENFKDEISRRLDEMLENGDVAIPSRPSSGSSVKNIAVDASSPLRDDRGTDAEKLYEDAARLAAELSGGWKQDMAEEDMRSETVDLSGTSPSKSKSDTEKPTYSGPSVVSYSLDGRKASLLKIPAYRCMGSGQVTVIITVNNAGTVVNAKIMEDVSSADECLRNFAIRAARLSKFSKSTTAPHNQVGEIVYEFIAQ